MNDPLENKPNGSWLMRDSSQENFTFTISYRTQNHTFSTRIEEYMHLFSFDIRNPSMYNFKSVMELLRHHSRRDENKVFKNPVQRKVPFSLKKLTRATICDSTSYEHIDKLQIPEVLKEFLKEHCYMHTNPEGVYYDVLSPLLSPKN